MAPPPSPGPESPSKRALSSLGLSPGYLLTAPLALLAIWGHRYPAGIDLPQHANLARLWVELGRGPVEYGALYRVNAFTPYVLAYALAYPFARWVSALVAVKVVLSLGALGTPLALARWLRVAGGEPRLGLLGFPIVFGFAYLWGFLSYVLALPILCCYLAAFEHQGEPSGGARGALVRALATTAWGAVLFFCHGVTFGVAAVSVAVRVVLGPRTLKGLSRGLHLVPLGGLALSWLWLREAKATEPSNWWFVDKDRLVTLFSGLFWPKASLAWGALTALAVVIVLAVARPRVNRSPAAWIPFAVACAGFLILPEYLASTYLVGTRFAVYVQMLSLGLLAADSARDSRRLAQVTAALVAGSLILLNVRLWRFNAELDGFGELAATIPARADVQALPRLGVDSEVFGPRELSEVVAWVAAANGGLVENDSARYFQMPIQRRPRHFPQRYRYVLARGDERRVVDKMTRAFPEAVLSKRAGPWLLFEQKPLVTGAIRVMRSLQDWGTLVVDRSVSGTPLSIGGVPHEHGLGTHARSLVRVRSEGRPSLEGACGVDDDAPPEASLSCRVVGPDGQPLWSSGPMSRGTPARPFSVALDENHEALLEVQANGSNAGDHADWVDLH